MTKGQLGVLLNACKAAGCRLQDLHEGVRGHLEKHGLQGAAALAYMKACVSENPGRDWTYQRRRTAELEAREATSRAEDKALTNALQRLAKAGKSGLVVTLRNGTCRLVLASEGMAEVLDSATGKSKGVAPLRQLLAQLPELGRDED
ncbi:MAG: hypothetical protein B7X42_07525 [Thiomonas sp. 14-66-4]|nr:MAG: hypothetical protein B7X42_07525 [Thiomonas sp. 14-66-4]